MLKKKKAIKWHLMKTWLTSSLCRYPVEKQIWTKWDFEQVYFDKEGSIGEYSQEMMSRINIMQ